MSDCKYIMSEIMFTILTLKIRGPKIRVRQEQSQRKPQYASASIFRFSQLLCACKKRMIKLNIS